MIDDRVHRIDAQSVEMKLIDTHQSILDEKLPDVIAMRSVEIQGHAPRGLVSIGEIRSELAQIVSFGAEVVVDDVEDHGQPTLMRSVDQSLQRLGTAIRVLRR